MSKAVIVGVGDGLSASLARKLAGRGHALVLAARNTEKLSALADETGAAVVACDASDQAEVERLFAEVDRVDGDLAVAIYNPSARMRGALVELEPEKVRHALEVTAFGAFLTAQQAARRMLDKGAGTILFTGASAGVKGFAQSAPFAMGKFALRGLSQSMARELHPKGIHVCHVVVDGGIENKAREGRQAAAGKPDSMLLPDAIADTYLAVIDQHRSAWSSEVEVRPWVENF